MTNITPINCWVYKSPLKADMYLYNDKKDDFSNIPDSLLTLFGVPDFVMQLELTAEKKLARVDIKSVLNSISTEGYFLQMPPKLEPYLYHGNDM